MLMVGRGKTALLSTPNGRQGFFYQEWIGKGSAENPWGGRWRRHRVSWRDVGCHEDGKPRITPADLEEERMRPSICVESEYLDCSIGAEFVATQGCAFDLDNWQCLLDNNQGDWR
jgi:hypothetical protein